MSELQQWYSLRKILRYDVPYYIIIGERSNGKTYSVKDYIISSNADNNGKFIYLRRRHEQVTRKLMVKLFDDINDVAFEKLGSEIRYSTENGFFKEDDKGNRTTVGYATSIEDMYTMKGIPFNEITTIFFDEFLEYGTKIEDELSRFINMISTIVRKRDNVRVFMVSNTITQFSEYFTLFGIDPKKLRMGHIYYLKHNDGVECAVEYCNTTNIISGVRAKNKYIGFDNNATSKMIMYGEWEYQLVNTKNVDGIGWSCRRELIPAYFTALGETYEMSIYTSDNPIAFIRKINVQMGQVRKEIRYNFSYDSSLILTNKKGVVPMYARVNKLVDDTTRNYMEIMFLCFDAKRIVFDTIATGSDFSKIITSIR